LADFLDFNDFTARAERKLARAGFEGRCSSRAFIRTFNSPAGRRATSQRTNRAPYPRCTCCAKTA
jgi:hypothetical protein